MDTNIKKECYLKSPSKFGKSSFNLRSLRLSLKYRPEILKLILKMRQCIRQKNVLLKKLKRQLKYLDIGIKSSKESSTQTNNVDYISLGSQTSEKNCDASDLKSKKEVTTAWIRDENGEPEKSIAEQVKEAAQSALQESGMVYVESAGMYYDYKTGYYYNSELGLYYHTDTGCYYYYSEDKKNFEFHSYPDRSVHVTNAPLIAHQNKKAKKNKKDQEDGSSVSKPKRKKISKSKKALEKEKVEENEIHDVKENVSEKDVNKEMESKEEDKPIDKDDKDSTSAQELEDGECSETGSEDEESDASTSTASDDEFVAKHHPPCMRLIVRETDLPKLKVGSLFLITKDGGTIGREGDHHAILIKDHNISRTHLDIQYDMEKRVYIAVDLGSKNGTILNGVRMSESQETSEPIEVVHGSTIQLGETKLLCHIHAGNDTCGHCEPGLIMESQEKEKKVAYTRTCSVQKQHQLELARLKNKYAKKQLAIDEVAYNDRAQTRREKVGSSHHAEKTQSSDINTFITPENKGFKLLEKMGWSKGEGLGKDNQGDQEPIPLISNEGKAGLGAETVAAPIAPTSTLGPATMRLAARTKMLQPPARAFQNNMDEDSE